MKLPKIVSIALLAMGLVQTDFAHAGAWTAGSASGAAGNQVVVPVSFAGDGATIVSQVTYSVTTPLSIVSATGQNGQSCSATGNSVTIVAFAFSPLPNGPTSYCDITVGIAPGAAAGSYPVTGGSQLCSLAGGGSAPTCTAAPGSVDVTAAALGPTIAYNPSAGATSGTGGPVNFTGVTTVGTTGNGTIVATPSGGAASGTTTLGSFSITGADAASFTRTSAATLTFTAGVNTPQN
ncbi:MAG: hypothetical protein KDI12_24450, partial [Anaerolineae bacterium]|nr:hypothetical protein [Anaerolineae bacterium]